MNNTIGWLSALSFFSCLFATIVCGANVWAQDSGSNPIRTALSPYVDNQTMGGFVSILADPNGALQIDCIGYADVENQIPMKPNTLFAIFSSSKSVCGAALAILIDQGKISLDDPVENYLPEFADVKVKSRDNKGNVLTNADGTPVLQAPARKLTIRDCMSHVTGSRFWFPLRAVPLREVARQLAAAPLDFEPGETFSYGNAWIDTGAAIIETVTGQKYEDFLQKNIFDPLGMVDTTFWPNEEQQSRMAKCYNGNGELVKDAQHAWLQFPQPKESTYADAAGGLYSTPQDFIRFSRMLAGHGTFEGKRIISEETFMNILAVKQTPDGISLPYTVGNWIYGTWLGHEGALRTDARANIQTGHARLYFVQTTGGKAFAQSKIDWNKAADEVQKTTPAFSAGN